MFDVMSWSYATPDEIDRGFDHFAGLRSASEAMLCELIQEADVAQLWMGDGSRSLSEWVSVRLRIRHEAAVYLVRVARRLKDLPILSRRFADGDFSIDQVDAISRVATSETEADVVTEALGLSNHMLDRMARRANPPSSRDEELVHRRRSLFLQWNLDESELRFNGNLPGPEGEVVQEALEARANRYGVNASTGIFDPYSTRLADALVELAVTTGDTTSQPPQVSVHVDFSALTTESDGVAELFRGALIPNETARRLCCDAVVQSIIEDGSFRVHPRTSLDSMSSGLADSAHGASPLGAGAVEP